MAIAKTLSRQFPAHDRWDVIVVSFVEDLGANDKVGRCFVFFSFFFLCQVQASEESEGLHSFYNTPENGVVSIQVVER